MRVRHSWLDDLVQLCGLSLSVGRPRENASPGLEERIDQVLGGATLVQVAGRSGSACPVDVVGGGGSRQHDHRARGEKASEKPSRAEAVEQGHVALVVVERQAERLGEQLVIVGDQDAKGRQRGLLVLGDTR
jgi:hypothetical protein